MTSQSENLNKAWRRKGTGRREGTSTLALICAVFLLLFAAVPAWGQDVPPELAFANKLYGDGLYLLAAQQYRDFALTHPSSPLSMQARFMVGESFFAQGDFSLAEEAYREFLATHTQSDLAPKAWLRLGTCLDRAGRFSEAAAAFLNCHRLKPEGPWAAEALFGMAEALRRAGDLDRALREFEVFVEKHPQSQQVYLAHLARGEILVHLGRWSQARDAFKAAASQAPSSEETARAQFREAQVLSLEGHEESAIELLSGLVELDSASSQMDSVLSLLGKLHLGRGEYQLAAEAFDILASGAQEDQLSEWAGFQQAQSLRLAGDYSESITAYRRWLKHHPQSQMAPEGMLGLSQSLREKGDLDSAVVILEELSQKTTGAAWEPQALLTLGDVRYELGHPGGALDVYREFLQRYPRSPLADSIYFRQAHILEKDLNRYQAALRAYETLSSLYPQSRFADQADFAVGRCHEAREDDRQALEAYRVFVQEHPLSPLYPLAQERIAYLRKFRVSDERLALEALLNMYDQRTSGALKAEEVDLRLGKIYFQDLKDFSSAAMALERFVQNHPESPLVDQALFQLSECRRTQAEMLQIEGDLQGAARAQKDALETCRRLLADHPTSAWADRCALWIIADVLKNDASQERDHWVNQVDLYASFLNTYGSSEQRGYAYLQIGRAYRELAAQDPWFFLKADSIFTVVMDLHAHSSWADTAALERIRIAQAHGDEGASLELIENFLAKFPHSDLQSQVLFIQAEIFRHRNEHLRAAELFRSVAQDFSYHSRSEEALLRWAESLWAAGNARGARRALEDFAQRYPQSPLWIRWVILQAQELVARGREKEARALLADHEMALSKDSLSDQSRLALGDLYVSIGMLPRALDGYQSLIQFFPDSPLVAEALEKIADAHFLNQDFAQAQLSYQQATDATADEDRRAYLSSQRIVCFNRLGRLQEAIQARQEFEKNYPHRSDLMAQLLLEEGQAQEGQGHGKEARHSFETVLKRYSQSPYAPEAQYHLGLMALKASEFAEAVERFESLLDSFPDSPWRDRALFKMGSAFFGLERYDQAAESYERVAHQAQDPDLVVDAWSNAGICRAKMNDWEGASDAYRRLLRDFPGHQDRDAWSLRLGFAYLQLDRPDQALTTFQQVDGGDDEELGAEIQFWVSECYFQMGDYEKAAQEYLRVAYLYPLQDRWAVTAEYNAAMSYEKLGREEEARTIYRKLVAARGPADQWGALARERLNELGD